jgi:hypothetical protein
MTASIFQRVCSTHPSGGKQLRMLNVTRPAVVLPTRAGEAGRGGATRARAAADAPLAEVLICTNGPGELAGEQLALHNQRVAPEVLRSSCLCHADWLHVATGTCGSVVPAPPEGGGGGGGVKGG